MTPRNNGCAPQPLTPAQLDTRLAEIEELIGSYNREIHSLLLERGSLTYQRQQLSVPQDREA